MSLFGRLKGKGESGFGYNSTAEEVTAGLDLSGRTYLLTGCNSGLGYEMLRVLTLRGAQVIGGARTLEKATKACESVGGSTIPLACELSEPDHVREAVATVRQQGLALSGIIANAGIMMLPRRTVKHGLELQFLTNHVGHFILITGIMDQLTDNGRVVMLSSTGHQMTYRQGIRFDDLDAAGGYSSIQAYGQTKLANILFSNHLATRLGANQTSNAVHPGVINTNLARHMPKTLTRAYAPVADFLANKTIAQGAATQCFVATHPSLEKVTGKYFSDCNLARTSRHGANAQMARDLWEKTEALVTAL
jgi:NAD(P)-dependent dehydrogenase (short-subunit alcohol dehydrogenase family)